MFDRDMFATQAGASIARVIPRLKDVLPEEDHLNNTANNDDHGEEDHGHNNTSEGDTFEDAFADEEELRLTNLFDLVRPPIPFSFHHILSQINQVFVLRTKPGETFL